MRFANKAEVMVELEKGGTIESHDCYHTLVRTDGTATRIRYSLWNILYRNLKQVRNEIRSPSRLRFYIYRLEEKK